MIDVTTDTAKLGVELLLLRMDTNPEEFDTALNTRWVWFLDALISTLYVDPERLARPMHRQLRFISRGDLEKLYAKVSKLQGTRFTECVTLAIHGVEEGELSNDRSPF